jgi:hypothetical protein
MRWSGKAHEARSSWLGRMFRLANSQQCINDQVNSQADRAPAADGPSAPRLLSITQRGCNVPMDIVDNLQPYPADFTPLASEFGDYLVEHSEEVSEALLSVTDKHCRCLCNSPPPRPGSGSAPVTCPNWPRPSTWSSSTSTQATGQCSASRTNLPGSLLKWRLRTDMAAQTGPDSSSSFPSIKPVSLGSTACPTRLRPASSWPMPRVTNRSPSWPA